jgi:IPT/TIG domain.
VTISGSDFQPGATVTFGGTAATTVKDFSMTTIYALAPVHAAGAVTVTVTNPDSQSGSRASAFTYACLLTTPLFAAPLTVEAGSPNRTASVPLHAGSTYLWTIENGTITAGQGTSQITFTAGVGGTPLTLSVTEQNACGSVSGNATITVTAGSAVFLPVVLDNVAGLGGSHYTTELTLASKATTAIQINLLYTASVGSGTGTVSVTLGPGETRIIPNTVAFLRSQGLSIPTSGSRHRHPLGHVR